MASEWRTGVRCASVGGGGVWQTGRSALRSGRASGVGRIGRRRSDAGRLAVSRTAGNV